MTADLLGHVAYVALVVGQLAVAYRRRWGFLLRVTGSLAWAALGVYLGLSSVWLWSAGFAAVDLAGYRRWR